MRKAEAGPTNVYEKPISQHATMTRYQRVAETVSSPRYRTMVARLIGSIPDQPDLMAIYFDTYLHPRRKVAADALELARAKGLVPKSETGKSFWISSVARSSTVSCSTQVTTLKRTFAPTCSRL